MKAINILWDVDDDEDEISISEILETLPTEVELPDDMEDEDEISDYLSDLTGFCHSGFDLAE